MGGSRPSLDNRTRLRRRSSRQFHGEYELLNHPRSVPEDDHRATDAVSSGEERTNYDDVDEAWGRPSAYDLKDSVLLDKGFSPHSAPSQEKTTPVKPLIDLDPMPPMFAPPPGLSQEDEIRSIIFDNASTSSSRVSRSCTPAPPTSAYPFKPEDTDLNRHASISTSSASSTSLIQLNALEEKSSSGIISLSQPYSRVPSPAGFTDQVLDDRPRQREDDVISVSETNTSGRVSDISGYEDAETYSPRSRAVDPISIHSLRPSLHQEDQGGLVEDFGMIYAVPKPAARRGPLSVVSMSESEGEDLGEGWRSEGEENEWEGLGP